MAKKEKLFNYTLSVAFILLIVIFLVLIIQISRFALSNESPIQEHVAETKGLLEGIDKVEKSVEINQEISEVTSNKVDRDIRSRANNFDSDVLDVSYLNMKNKSIVSFRLNSNIKQMDNFYYLEYKNSSYIFSNDLVLYDIKKIGLVLNFDGQEFKVFNLDEQAVEDIKFGEILGKIVYKDD